jgi:hypothetical protein
MKYSQYIELEKLLNENNLTIDDVRENPEVLNEIGIVGGIVAGVLGGLGILFRKYLLSWGIKGAYIKKLNFVANRFKKRTLKNVSALGKKSIKFRQGLVAKNKKIEHIQGPEAEEEKKAIQQQKQNWDNNISKNVNKFIEKTTENKTKEIYNKVDNLKRATDGHKMALKNYWERLISDIKLDTYQKLSDDGIITDPDVLKNYEQIATDQKEEAKFNLRNIKKILRRERTETIKKKEGKKESEEKSSLTYKIDNLKNSKGMMSEINFLRKLRMIMVDAQKMENKVEQKKITDLLTQKFDEDTLRDAVAKGGKYKEQKPEEKEKEPEEKEKEKERLEPEDNI